MTGREALRESFDQQLREVGITILFVGNHVIDFEGDDKASGHVYCRAEVQDGERWIHQAILYRDRYRRCDGQWYFVRRLHRLWYGLEAPTSPIQQPDARHGHPWRFNITPILGRYARTELVCPIPGRCDKIQLKCPMLNHLAGRALHKRQNL